MATSVGILLDKDYIAAVKLEGNMKSPIVADFACEVIASQKEGQEIDPYSYRAKILDEFLKKNHFPRLNIYLSLSSEYCLLRQFTVPFLAEDQIRKTVRFEAESHIHSTSIEELEIQHNKIGELKNRSEIVIFGTRRDALQETIKALKKFQIEPLGIDIPASSIANHFLFQPESAVEEPELWINIGVEHTTFAVVKNETIAYIREMKAGIPLPSKFVKTIDLKDIKVVKASNSDKLETADSSTEDTKVATDPKIIVTNGEAVELSGLPNHFNPEVLAEKLMLEIKRTFVSMATLSIKKIRIFGGGVGCSKIVEKLKEKLPSKEISEFEMPYGFKVKEEAKENFTLASQALAVPIGVALKGFTVNKLNIEFRRGEFALKDAFEMLKTPLTVSVLLLMFLFMSIFVYFFINKQQLDDIEVQMYDEMTEIFNNTYFIKNKHIKQMPTAETGYLDAINSAYIIIETDYYQSANQGSYKGLPKIHSVLDVWREIFDKMEDVGREEVSKLNEYGQVAPSRNEPNTPDPKYKDKLKIEFSLRSLNIDNNSRRNTFKIEGFCKDNYEIVNLRNYLSRVDMFTDVEHKISEITDPIREKSGKVYDTRPKFEIKGSIFPKLGNPKEK